MGFQRQADILIDAQDKLAIIEIKKAGNLYNPFEQLIEYLYYCISSLRLNYCRSSKVESIDLIAVIEQGNKYLMSDFVETFIKKCTEITDMENITINPHAILFELSNGILETEQYKT